MDKEKLYKEPVGGKARLADEVVSVRKKMFFSMEEVCFYACEFMKYRNPNMEKKLEAAVVKFETERANPEIALEVIDVDKPEPEAEPDERPLAVGSKEAS